MKKLSVSMPVGSLVSTLDHQELVALEEQNEKLRAENERLKQPLNAQVHGYCCGENERLTASNARLREALEELLDYLAECRTPDGCPVCIARAALEVKP